MIKRAAIIGIGTVLLVIGLAGLGLLQTGVIYPSASTESVSLPEVNPPEQAAGSDQGSQGPVNQTAQPPAPAGGPPDSGPGQTSAQVEQQPPSGGPPSEKPVPVPQAEKGERYYPRQDQLAQPQPSTAPPEAAAQKRKFDEKRFQALLKSESTHYARKSESKRYARKSEVETLCPQRAFGSHRAARCDQVQFRSGAESPARCGAGASG